MVAARLELLWSLLWNPGCSLSTCWIMRDLLQSRNPESARHRLERILDIQNFKPLNRLGFEVCRESQKSALLTMHENKSATRPEAAAPPSSWTSFLQMIKKGPTTRARRKPRDSPRTPTRATHLITQTQRSRDLHILIYFHSLWWSLLWASH
jgi:hypothetical protein